MTSTGRSPRRVRLACAVAMALVAVAAPGAAAAEPIDPLYPGQTGTTGSLTRLHWSWDLLEAARYADVAFPTIAVVDSGIAAGHEEFADEGTIDPGSADCSNGRAVTSDPGYTRLTDLSDVSHGTIVAGLAAAPANGFGIVGVSPFSTILAVRIRPDLFGLACALQHLATQFERGSVGLMVVNLSLTDPRLPSPAVQRALKRLVRNGALVVGATGNRGQGSRLGYPARLPHVLAIGDVEGKALLPGPQLDLLAPGGGLRAPLRGPLPTSYGEPPETTTSWATALASGAAAAVWGAHPSGSEFTAQQVAYVLRSTARNNGRWRARQGFGLIDVGKALDADPNAIPADDESEPNDTATDAAEAARFAPVTRLRCGAACVRHGILGTTDDAADWWEVAVPAGKRACPSITRGAGVRVRMEQGSRAGVAYAKVTTRRALAGYTLRVRLATRC